MTRYRDAAIVPVAARRVVPTDGDDPAAPAVGKWYWVKDEPKWLGCVVHVGSNFVKIKGPSPEYSGSTVSTRVHFDDFYDRCEHEIDPEAVIADRVAGRKKKIGIAMLKIREITDRLSITPGLALSDGPGSTALALHGGDKDVSAYKHALVRAKDKDLPKLFEEIRGHNEMMSSWMKATLIPLEAQVEAMEPTINAIKTRIFSVELYAGLVEEVSEVSAGEPAAVGEKVHLMQRRCYMDEECLADYQAGGMDYRKLGKFDAWLARPRNRDRIMPFPRCVVAFQIRRNRKEREVINISDFIRVPEEEKADKKTFLYMRNGERIYRLSTEVEFDEKLFPDLDEQLLSKPLRAHCSSGAVHDLITEDQWLGMVEEEKELEEKRAKAPEKDQWHFRSQVDTSKYEPFDGNNVHYDDIARHIQEEMARHNRLVLVLQGLLDRSPVFHPHPAWQIWTRDGFAAAVALVYDDSRALVAGDKPDFEAYRARLNASLREGSITVGQDDAWALAEGEKESKRMDADYNHKGYWRPERHRPYGNPGPGVLARVEGWSKKKATASFAWNRDAKNWRSTEKIRTTFSCPASTLLCVDAYEPGDFHKFFDDPRTRAEYLQWAPLLLAAEDYHAGKRETPPEAPPPKPKESSWEGQRRYARRKERLAVLGKIVGLRRSVTLKSGKKYEKDTIWLASSDGRGAIFLTGCDANGVLEKGERIISGMAVSDVYVVGTPKEKSE